MFQHRKTTAPSAHSPFARIAVTAAAFVAFCALAGLGVLNAAGGAGAKPVKVTFTGVTATFTDATTDNIRGDGSSYVGNPALSTSFGAFFTTNSPNDFSLRLDGTPTSKPRSLVLDFTDPVNTPPCAPGIQCRKNFDLAQIFSTWGPNGMRVIPQDANGVALVGGMEAIGVGHESAAILVMNFLDPFGRTLIWKLGFPAVRVTRETLNTWTISSAGPATLEVSPDGSTRKRTDEGDYSMPFTLTVTK